VTDDYDPTEPQTDGELIRMTYRMVKGMSESIKDHEDRVRCLETNQWKILGLALGISLATGIILSVWRL
jgi:hypothetical protein